MSERRDEGCRAAVGARLKVLRMGRGLTQQKLGEHLGVTFQQIHKYESGMSDISVPRLLALARALDVPPSYLLEASSVVTESLKPTNRLGRFRRERMASRGAVATAAGMSEQHLSNLETGRRELTVKWLIRLSNVLGCHPWELVDPTYANRPGAAKPARLALRGRQRRLSRS